MSYYSTPLSKSTYSTYNTSQSNRPVSSASKYENTTTSSIYPKYQSIINTTPDPKKYQIPFDDLDLDLEPINTREVLPSFFGYNNSKNEDQLADVPNLRRFCSKSTKTSVHLVLGCALFEKIIENDKSSLIQTEIIESLRYLQTHRNIPNERQIAYQNAENDFEAIMKFIKRCEYLALSYDTNKAAKIKKQFYQEVKKEVYYPRTIATSTRAVFLAYMLKSSSKISQNFKDNLWNEPYIFDDFYLREICQLFVAIFSFKVDLLEINLSTKKISKYELEPYSKMSKSLTDIVLIYAFPFIGQCEYKALCFPEKQTFTANSQSQGTQGSESNYKMQKYDNGRSDFSPSMNEEIQRKLYGTDTNQSKIPTFKTTDPLISTVSNGANTKTNDELELVECTLCGGPLRRSDVFENKGCYHRYCIYCIQEMDYVDRVLCPLKGCSKPLIASEIRIFVKIFYDRQKSIEEAAEKTPIKTQSPLKTSPKTELTKEQISSVKVEQMQCVSCKRKVDASKIFENHCGHGYCIECTQAVVESNNRWCFLSSCPNKVDLAKMTSFLTNLFTDDMKIMQLSCKSCNNETQFQYQKTCKPDYYKCSNCKHISCVKHDDLMVKCLCYCEKCLNSLEYNLKTMGKSCQKCGKGYCTLCGENTTERRRCDCICPICLNKKTRKTDILCESCLTNPTTCPDCYDVMDEYTEVKLPCGHKVCITCKQLSYEPKSPALACKVCLKTDQRFQNRKF